MDPVTTSYTLTGAADWPMFMAMGSFIGVLIALMIAMVGFMWHDLRNQILKWDEGLKDQIKDRDKAHHIQCIGCKSGLDKDNDAIWAAIDECCPRRSGSRVKEIKE